MRKLIFPNHWEPAVKEAIERMDKDGQYLQVIRLEIDKSIESDFNQLVFEAWATPNQLVQLGVYVGTALIKSNAL